MLWKSTTYCSDYVVVCSTWWRSNVTTDTRCSSEHRVSGYKQALTSTKRRYLRLNAHTFYNTTRSVYEMSRHVIRKDRRTVGSNFQRYEAWQSDRQHDYEEPCCFPPTRLLRGRQPVPSERCISQYTASHPATQYSSYSQLWPIQPSQTERLLRIAGDGISYLATRDLKHFVTQV
jgi:hypothetical protein